MVAFIAIKGSFGASHNGGNQKSRGKGDFSNASHGKDHGFILPTVKFVTMRATLQNVVMIDMRGLILMPNLLKLFLSAPLRVPMLSGTQILDFYAHDS